MALTKVAPAGIGSTPGDGYRIGSSFLHSTGVEITNINATGILTAASLDISGGIDFDGHTELDNVNIAGVVTATTFKGDGSELTNVISGVELKSDGNSVGTAITQINFSGFGSVTAPVSGFSTVTQAKQLTIGVRTGTAVTFSIVGSSFIVQARGGGDVDIDL